MNDDFLKQLNSASRSKEEVLNEKHNQMIRECHQNAKDEYEEIKSKLLQQVSEGNYVEIDGKKHISYLYLPWYKPCNYIFDDGVHREIKGRFNPHMKITDTGIMKYTPREPEKWNCYIEELKRLGYQEGISITAVMKSYYGDVLCSYPTTTNDKRFMMSGGLYLKCTADF